jgi:hypothetical protein
MARRGLDSCWIIAVSFVGPSSGSLILRLKHRIDEHNTTLVLTVLGHGTSFTLAIPKSLTFDDINLHPIGSLSSQLSFIPNTRNNLILHSSPLQFSYRLNDLQLLDEGGSPYAYSQPSQCNISVVHVHVQ